MENQGIIKDGKICQEDYEKANPKILWVLKQAYNKDGKCFDLIKFLNEIITVLESKENNDKNEAIDKKIVSIEDFETSWKTFYPIALTTCGVFDIKYTYQYETFCSLKKIALINIIKKVGLKKTTPQQELEKEYEENKNELNEQIESYKPDVIIFGLGTGNKCLVKKIISKLKNLNKDNISFDEYGNYWSFFKTDNMLFILTDHPSSFCNSRDGQGDIISLPAAVDDIVAIIKDNYPHSHNC